MVTCSLSKEKLSSSQQEKVKKECSKNVGKFLALRDEYDYLPNILVTLSSKKNRLTDTIELRNKFIKMLNQIKKDYELAYFTAIEFDSINNDEYKTWYNWHCHIQLFTNIPIEKLQACLNKLPTDMCQFNDIQESDNEDARFDYVIKDCKKETINWDLHSIMKLKFPKKSLYTMSRKELPDYLYKKISVYLNSNFKEKWKEVKYKYKFIKELLKNRDILIENDMTDEDYESLKNINIIDTVIAKTKQLLIKKENIFKEQKQQKLDIDDELIIKKTIHIAIYSDFIIRTVYIFLIFINLIFNTKKLYLKNETFLV